MNANNKNQKQNILILTGIAAEQLVKDNSPKNATVRTLPINIAAFITKEFIEKNLSRNEVQGFDLVLVPGFIKGDLTSLEKKFEIPFLKGPRYANDIKFAIVENNPFNLSPKYPADIVLKEQKYRESHKILEEGFTKQINVDKGEFFLGREKGTVKYPVSLTRPPLIMAEVVDATTMTNEEIISRVDYYLQNGVEIIDIGATVKIANPKKVTEIVQTLKELQKKVPFAISIDSLNTDEILAASKAGVDLILSIDHGNFDNLIGKIPKDVGIVFIPTNTKKGIMPKTPKERVKSLLKLKNKLIHEGYTKIFADPIIEIPIQPGFINSLEGYIQYRKNDTKTPMMTCVGNITEFIETDPVGINVLFGCIAVELGIQLLLATDVSVKCRGGVSEITKGRNLAYVSKIRKSPPKSHGIDILLAKSRTGYDMPIEINNTVEVIKLAPEKEGLYSLEFDKDPKGSFTIWIDYHKQKIFVTHLDYKNNQPDLLFVSSSAREILEEITKRKLISKLDHAFYMGRELERAEICLFLGKTYIQNEQVFKEKKNYKEI